MRNWFFKDLETNFSQIASLNSLSSGETPFETLRAEKENKPSFDVL